MNNKIKYDCYEGNKHIGTGTWEELSKLTDLKIITLKNYAYGPGGHRFTIKRRKSETLQ